MFIGKFNNIGSTFSKDAQKCDCGYFKQIKNDKEYPKDDFPGNFKFRNTLSLLSKQELIDLILVYSPNRAEMNTVAKMISN